MTSPTMPTSQGDIPKSRRLALIGALFGISAQYWYYSNLANLRTPAVRSVLSLAAAIAITVGIWWVVIAGGYKEHDSRKWRAIIGPLGLGQISAGLALVSILADNTPGMVASGGGVIVSFVASALWQLRPPHGSS